jgi:K+-transporting ATPase c subunit
MDPTQNHNNGAPIIVVVLDLVLSFSPMVSVLILSFFFVESANGSFKDMGENEKIGSLIVNLHKSKTNNKKEKRH